MLFMASLICSIVIFCQFSFFNISSVLNSQFPKEEAISRICFEASRDTSSQIFSISAAT